MATVAVERPWKRPGGRIVASWRPAFGEGLMASNKTAFHCVWIAPSGQGLVITHGRKSWPLYLINTRAEIYIRLFAPQIRLRLLRTYFLAAIARWCGAPPPSPLPSRAHAASAPPRRWPIYKQLLKTSRTIFTLLYYIYHS